MSPHEIIKTALYDAAYFPGCDVADLILRRLADAGLEVRRAESGDQIATLRLQMDKLLGFRPVERK